MNSEQLILYAVTDRSYLKGITLKEAVIQALEGGVSILQLREKNMEREELRREAAEILEICKSFGVPFILDDDVKLAAEIGADGVHIGQDDMPADEARKIMGKDKIIGVTAKTVQQAQKAYDAGADYLGSGAMFATTTKPGARPMTPGQLSEITQCVPIPVVAIGGITAENIMQLKGCGIAGAAVSAGIFDSADIKGAAKRLGGILPGIVSGL